MTMWLNLGEDIADMFAMCEGCGSGEYDGCRVIDPEQEAEQSRERSRVWRATHKTTKREYDRAYYRRTRTSTSTGPRLSDDVRSQIQSLARSGMRVRQIARQLGVHPNTVRKWSGGVAAHPVGRPGAKELSSRSRSNPVASQSTTTHD